MKSSFLNKVCFVLFLAVFLPDLASAEVATTDAKLGFYSRTYPLGAQITGTGGISALLWGDSKSWKYGYARLGINLATSAVVNRAGFEAQINPISIVSLSAGYDWGMRGYVPKYIDCGIYQCSGRADRRFVKAQGVGAYQGVVLSFLARYEEIRAPNATKPFFDEVTLLTGSAAGAPVLTLNPALLVTVDEVWKVGGTSLYSRVVGTDQFTHLYGPVASFQAEPNLSFIGGAGLNRSPVVHNGWAAFFVVQYTLKPSLNIADLPLRTESYSSLF